MSLIAHQAKELFAPSWIAGTLGSQSLSKSFKSHDIEAVNVIKTCEKLRSSLMQKSNLQQRVGAKNEKQCAVRDPELTFRTCTNLWYGTLKIYEQQVNNLLRQSHDLVLRSSTYDVKSLDSSKRKSSDTTSHKMIKKRRVTISQANESTFLTTNYSDLLDDLERITQNTMENNLDEPPKKSSCTRPLAQLQIREITIREISATTYGDDDDDTGFGEATHEEISQFFNFVEGTTNPDKRKTPMKRKMTYDVESPAKHRFSHDSTIEQVRNGNISMSNDFLSTPPNFRCSSLERQISPAKTIESFLYPENESLTETNKENIVGSSTLLQQNCFEKTISNKNDIPLIDIKEEKQEDEYVKSAHEVGSSTNKQSKLIIDKCIKIEESEIIDQIKRSPDLKKINKMIFKKLKMKKSVTALELLTRFNRRAFKLTISFKQKISLKPEQFRRDYLNLLSDILKIDFNEEWASEIYPKWQQTKNPPKRTNLKRSNKTPNKQKQNKMLSTILNILDENSNIVQIDDNNNSMVSLNDNNNPMDIVNDYIPQQDCQKQTDSLNYTGGNEWRPFGVMMKLLDMWRYSTKNEIEAVDFCNSAKLQIDKAITFYSLLNLSKNQFIEITKRPHTNEMNKIVLGKATQNLIDANK